MMAKPTLYEILGVSRTATETELKQRYRVLAREYHPDVNASPDAEETFKKINLAYATLSDSLKRADYDQSLQHSGVRRDPGAPSAGSREYANANTAGPAYDDAPSSDYDSPYRRAIIRAALARSIAATIIGGALGMLLTFGLGTVTGQPFGIWASLAGFIGGAALGGFYAADQNFKVETFLGTGWLGRSYTFARTILFSLSLAYFLGLIGAATDSLVREDFPVFGPVLVLVGILAGAVIGSDGDTPEKLRSDGGRFNLFYTFLRGAEVGALGGLIGAALGFILSSAGIAGIIPWTAFSGFCLGMIVGSIKPPNLAAYASYASASVKNVLVMIMVLVALLAGMGFGTVFQPSLSNLAL